MSLVADVQQATRRGRSPGQIAGELAVPRPLVDAVVEQLRRVGSLPLATTPGCAERPACPAAGCSGCALGGQ